MAELSKTDLDFILQQILIAEEHATLLADGKTAGTDLAALLPNMLVPFGLRTVDGSYNNLLHPFGFGVADNLFPRLLDPVFRPAEGGTSYGQTSGFVFDSQPRVISNLIVDQTANNPAAVAAASENPNATTVTSPGLDGIFGTTEPTIVLSSPPETPAGRGLVTVVAWFTFFGQFFDHGLDLDQGRQRH